MELTDQDKAQLKANLVELHGRLGIYADFISQTGSIEIKGEQNVSELAAIAILSQGIEQRVAKMP